MNLVPIVMGLVKGTNPDILKDEVERLAPDIKYERKSRFGDYWIKFETSSETCREQFGADLVNEGGKWQLKQGSKFVVPDQLKPKVSYIELTHYFEHV